MFSSCCRCVSKKSIQQDDSDNEILKGSDDKSIDDLSKDEFLDENTIKFTGIGYDEGKKVYMPLQKDVSQEKIESSVADLDHKWSEASKEDEDDATSDDTALVHKSTDEIDKLATTTNTTASISSIENGKPVDEKILQQNNDRNTASDETTSSISCNTVVESEVKEEEEAEVEAVKSNSTSFDNDESPPAQDPLLEDEQHSTNVPADNDADAYDDDNGFNPQVISSVLAKRESIQSEDLSGSSRIYPESCMSRRCSSKSSIKKRVIYNENPEVIPSPEYINYDDDEVFSDSIEAQLPRGDMCTPYLLKRGSLPGMLALPEWFSDREEGGILEPPTTPIGRDELALRRHRFFSELLTAAQAAVEHRVRFDSIGPEEIVVEGT